jgi:hypothetical protein
MTSLKVAGVVQVEKKNVDDKHFLTTLVEE